MQNRFNIENNRNKNKQLSEQRVKIRKYPVLFIVQFSGFKDRAKLHTE